VGGVDGRFLEELPTTTRPSLASLIPSPSASFRRAKCPQHVQLPGALSLVLPRLSTWTSNRCTGLPLAAASSASAALRSRSCHLPSEPALLGVFLLPGSLDFLGLSWSFLVFLCPVCTYFSRDQKLIFSRDQRCLFFAQSRVHILRGIKSTYFWRDQKSAYFLTEI
jgi:hypothetical protein